MISELENRILAAFDTDNAWKQIEHLVHNLGGRHAGSEQERQSAEYIAEQLSQFGLNPKIQEVDSWLGVPREAYLRIEEPTSLDIACASDTGYGQEVRGELIVVETSEQAWNLQGQLKDKIILMPYAYALPITPEDIHKQGGAGLIYGNWGPSNIDILRVTAPQTWTYWGLPDPDTFRAGEQEALPQAHIGRKSYERLRNMCQAGRVVGTFKSTIESFWGKSHQVIADIDSEEGSPDFMMMAAHHDSWFPGASDDAAGVGALMEIGRVLNQHRDKLNRTVRLIFVSGHENGAYATSTWYLDNHWQDIKHHAVCFSFIDTPGFGNAPEYKLEVSEELAAFTERCARDVVGPNTKLNIHRPNKTADRGFYAIGVPSIYTRCAFTPAQAEAWGGAFLGYWNHSDNDTLDKLDKKNLEQNARIRLLEALRLSSSDLLPYDFRPVVKGMCSRLEQWNAAGHYDLTGTLELTTKLEQKVEAFQEQIASSSFGKQDEGRINDALKRLSRTLTWVNYTYNGKYKQDIFGVNLTKPLPIMNSIDLLPYHKAGSPMDTMLKAKIRRDQNKVEDAFSDAIEVLKCLN